VIWRGLGAMLITYGVFMLWGVQRWYFANGEPLCDDGRVCAQSSVMLISFGSIGVVTMLLGLVLMLRVFPQEEDDATD